MKKLKKRKSNAIFLGVLIFVFLISVFAPSLDASICETALQKCMVDATIAGITGGIIAGLIWSSACLSGYDWCLRYYVN